MEILNNIWVALSTPNEGLLNVLSIPLYFVEAFLTMYLFLNVIGIDSTRKQRITYIISFPILGLLTMKLIPNPFNIYINYLVMFTLICIIFKSSILRKCLSLLIALVIFNLVGAFLLNPFLTMFRITSDELSSIPLYRLSYMLIVYMLVTIIILIFKAKNLKLNFFEDIDTKSKLIIFINFVLGIIAIIIQSITLYYFVDSLPILITFANFITFLVYFAISIYNITRVFKLFATNKEVEREK